METFTRSRSCPPDRANGITSLLAELVARDLRPLRIVEGRGFKQLLNFIEPNYRVPSRPHLQSVVKKLHDTEKKKLLPLLKSRQIAFTTDIWTSSAVEAYMTVTAHFVNDDWHLEAKVLDTQEMAERHTGVNIAERMKEVFEDWGISDDHVAGVVHDNAANACLAISIGKWPDIACFAHTLQLSVRAGLAIVSVSRLIGAARKLVGHFKHSALATTALKSKQQSLSIPQHALIQDVVTRWNSTYFMLERLTEQRWAIYGVLHDDTISKPDHKRLDLSDAHWKLASELLAVLKALQLATTAVCEDQNVSVSLVYPLVYGLLKKHLVVTTNDSPTVSQFKQTVSSDLRHRYDPDNPDIADEVPILATAIDPRYHHLKFLSEEQRSSVHSKLKELAVELQDDPQEQVSENSEEPPAKKPKKESAIEFLLGGCFDDMKNQSRGPQEELDIFFKEPTASQDTYSLKWWEANEHRLPHLTKLVKRLLCIPATSVSAERVFSTSGLIVTKQRASLNPDLNFSYLCSGGCTSLV